jgi:hypothetical protein
MIIKKVVLHIGHDKTATCSIQDTFKHNSSILEDHGFYYPLPDGHTHHNKLFIILFKEDLYRNKSLLLAHEIELSRIDEIRRDLRRWLTEKLLNTTATTIIFSGEDFPNFNESELEAIKAFFTETLGEVEFLIYAYTRDPVSYASSAFQQRARLFPTDTKVIYFRYEEQIGRYIEAFGRKRIKLFKFEDACEYAKGPVCFLLSKIGLTDDLVDRMQMHNDNESMSDMAVDLLLYINKKVPYTEHNLKEGLRKRFDCKHLISLPGKKFQLLETDAVKLINITRRNMIWLNDNFDINYSTNQKPPKNGCLAFDGAYVEEMIVVLQKVSPVMKKLIYDYIRLMATDASLGVKSHNNLRVLETHFKQNYALTTKLSYTMLAYPQKLFVFIYKLLKRSKALRLLKRRWIDKPVDC